MGVDYKKYIRFKLITPTAVMFDNAKDVLLGQPIKENFIDEDYFYCRDFIIETALILQRFKIEIRDNEFYRPLGIY